MAKLSRIANVVISLGTLAIAERSFNDFLILVDQDGNGDNNNELDNRVAIVTGTEDLSDLGIDTGTSAYSAVAAAFSQTPHVRQVYIGFRNTDTDGAGQSEPIADALQAAANEAPGYWYGLALVSREPSDVQEAALWAEANERLFLTASDDDDIVTDADSDIASLLQAANYERTAVLYTKSSGSEYPEIALMANRFTYYAGAETWANVQLSAVTSDNLTETQYAFAKDKNVTTFENFRNFAVSQGGRTAFGEWIDVIRLRDQLVESIKVSVVGAIVRATNGVGKLPFTDSGIQVIGNAIQQPLDLNVRRGGIAPEELDANDNVIPSYTIDLPRAYEISTNDKANRVLKDVYFTARLAGAIHTTEIKGSLVYDFN